jgi:hypothetical protein
VSNEAEFYEINDARVKAGFFNFGHHAPPYEKTAPAAPKASCAGCHQANADKDMVFTGMYPILRDYTLWGGI